MPIVEGLERRLPELGRIRTGVVAHGRRADGSTYDRPSRIETFRLTSRSRELVEAAAEAYGGRVDAWQPHGGAAEAWSVVTASDRLEVLVPPAGAWSAWWELWSGGALGRRCDGRVQQGSLVECACPADPTSRREAAAKGRACRPTSRLSVILPALPGLGTWRLDTHSVYAAIELPGAVELLARASAAGAPVVATLRLDQRERRVVGQPTSIFSVPVLDVPPAAAPALLTSPTPAAGLLTAGAGAPASPPPSRDRGTPALASTAARVTAPGLRQQAEPGLQAIAAAAAALYPGIRNLEALAPMARARIVDEARRRLAASSTGGQ